MKIFLLIRKAWRGCEGDLAATLVTPLMPGLIRLVWLARQVSPSSFTAPRASLPKVCAQSKRTTFPVRGGDHSSVKGL